MRLWKRINRTTYSMLSKHIDMCARGYNKCNRRGYISLVDRQNKKNNTTSLQLGHDKKKMLVRIVLHCFRIVFSVFVLAHSTDRAGERRQTNRSSDEFVLNVHKCRMYCAMGEVAPTTPHTVARILYFIHKRAPDGQPSVVTANLGGFSSFHGEQWRGRAGGGRKRRNSQY